MGKKDWKYRLKNKKKMRDNVDPSNILSPVNNLKIKYLSSDV